MKMFSTLALHTLSTFLIGVGCAYPLALSLGLNAPFVLCAACCALSSLVFALLDCVPRIRFLGYPLLFAAIAALVLPFYRQLPAVSAALTLLMNGQPLALAAYSRVIVLLFSLLFTGVGASLARSEQAFFPLGLLSFLLLFVVSFLGGGVSPISLLPLAVALLLASRAPGVRLSRLLGCAAAVLICVAFVFPLAGSTIPKLEQTAQTLRRAIDDYFFFTDPRTTFSLNTTGYQPLGVQQLGGPAAPEEEPVMQVETSGRALLRGTIKNTYNGHSWLDTTSGRRYLYVNPRFSSLKKTLFDQDRPNDFLPEPETITVSMRAESASTLYLTQRFRAPSGREIVPYFSPSSEVFGTRSLSPGDSYTFTGTRFDADTPGVRDAVVAASTLDDPNLETVRSTYTQLPDGIDPQVYQLVGRLTEGLSTDFDRAMMLQAHLRTSYRYTLEQHTPPYSRDFVSWFLLEEKQGYCTSFASALAVMARMAGLPSRYIEGYSAVPDVDGRARVTQKNAHAWTEIYFPGFGWLPFDPTPGENGSGNLPSLPQDSGDSSDDPSDAPDDGTDNPPDDAPPENGTVSPSPTPSPTPTPVPTPSPTPQHNNPSVTPTPTFAPTPERDTPAPTPSPTVPPTPPDDWHVPPFFWGLLIFILIVSCAALRLFFCAPERAAARKKSSGEALLVWYAAVEEALLCLGIAPAVGEAPATFLWRAQQTLNIPLTNLGKALCLVRYSPHGLTRAQAADAKPVYLALLKRMTLPQKLRLFARRLLWRPQKRAKPI